MLAPLAAPVWDHRLQGSLRLVFTHDPALDRTLLQVAEQTPPLKVLRAFHLPDGAALAHLHNVSGGILGGDDLAVSVTVGPGAQAQLTTTGATRVYRHRPGLPDAQQHIRLSVEAGALLEYLPDPLIPFRHARYRQSTHITLAPAAGLFWWETVAPGRVAHGECFEYDWLEMTLAIEAEQRPLALERFQLRPRAAPLSSPVRLGAYQYFTTFYICRAGVPEAEWLALEAELAGMAQAHTCAGQSLWGVSTLPAAGLVIRGFSQTARALPAALAGFWRAAKRRLYQRDITWPRKTY